MIAWVPRAGDRGFGVSVISYAGDVIVGYSTDADLIPDPCRLQELSLAELARVT